MTTITLTYYRSSAADTSARIMPGEDGWEPAAARAIRKAFGRGAAAWGWTMDSREVDRAGNTTRVEYKATVVGKPRSRHDGHPILAEARLWMAV